MDAQHFREAIQAYDLTPPEHIEPDKFYRFPGQGKGQSNEAGWCKLFPDGMGGVFGDYSTGLSESWQAKREKPHSASEREVFKRQTAEARQQAEAAEKVRHAEAAEQATALWNEAHPAPDDHAYLTRKGIKANGARVHDGRLVIPLQADGDIQSLQFIGADGEKRFLPRGRVSGGYFSIGKPDGVLCIAEGFATGASIHEATGYAVAVAFSTGNLLSVAKCLRERFPDIQLIVCADDDDNTKGNPGLTKATEAARSVAGLIAIPDFGTNRPKKATDFNDLTKLCGKDAVRQAIADAKTPEKAAHPANGENAPERDSDRLAWPEPQPLTVKVNAEPYPLDALPDAIRAAVDEVASFVKAPLPMVASSALAAMSLAIQAHVDAQRAEKLSGPVGLFLLTIADSGERKSTCDSFFTQAIRDYEVAQAAAAKPIIKDYQSAFDLWEAKRAGIKDQIRHLAKTSEPTDCMKSALRELENDKPDHPKTSRLIYSDVTPEKLAYNLGIR